MQELEENLLDVINFIKRIQLCFLRFIELEIKNKNELILYISHLNYNKFSKGIETFNFIKDISA